MLPAFRSFTVLVMSCVCASICLSSSAAPTTQRSEDGRYAITLPDGWKPTPDDSNYDIVAVCGKKHARLIVGVSEKEDVVDLTLERFDEQWCASFSEGMSVDLDNPERITVNGRPAIRREIRLVRDSARWTYLYTAIETENSFVLVSCCTAPSRFSAEKKEFEQITQSLRMVSPSDSDASTAAKDSAVATPPTTAPSGGK
jgi:hypothetical protein